MAICDRGTVGEGERICYGERVGAGGTIVKVGGRAGRAEGEDAKRSNGDVRNARACAAPTVATLSAPRALTAR